MTFRSPLMLAVAVLVTVIAVAGYVLLHRRRTAALAATGLGFARGGVRRHVPYVLILVALPLLLAGLARPQATVDVPRRAGTVMLAIDVSTSMAAKDLSPSRLGAAQAAARAFVEAQPDTVDVGMVVFSQGALTTVRPTTDRPRTIAAINRLNPDGGTSLGQAILAALTEIVGKPVGLPDPDSGEPPPDLGFWRSATILLFSDGQETGGPDVEAATDLAAGAGVRIETVGVGTTRGTTVEVDGFQVATALDEELLSAIADGTGGTYRAAGDAESLREISRSIDLRITTEEEELELTGFLAGAALLLLTIGGLLMIRVYGRVV